MGSLDSKTLQYLDGVVKETVQERKKYPSVSHLIDEIINRAPFLSREFLEKNRSTLFDLWMAHSHALDDTELPPSPPESTKNLGHPGPNGSPSTESSGPEGKLIVPAEDPERTECVSLAVHLEKLNIWKGMRGLYGTRKETYISQKIVDRYNLPVEDKTIYLTWVLGDESKTSKTCFLVVPDDLLSSDCLLGTHCKKGDEENEEQHDDDDERNSEGSQARLETFMDSSLCRIPPKGFSAQEPGGVETKLALMNADALFRYNQLSSEQGPHRLLENGGYNMTNGQRN